MRKNAVVIGAEHPLAGRLCQIWLSQGWTVFAAITEDYQVTSHERMSAVRFNPHDTRSVQRMAEQAGETLDVIDMVVCCLDRRKEAQLRDGINSRDILEMYDYNVLASLRTIEALLPHMSAGNQRIAFLSDVGGSINETSDFHRIGYDMSLAAKRMAIQIMSNSLGRDGFTFRLAMLDLAKPSLTDELAFGISTHLADITDREPLRTFHEACFRKGG